MNYIENVYICLIAPLLIAILCFGGRERRNLLFLLGGMTVCLLSSYISTFPPRWRSRRWWRSA